MQPLRR